MPVREPAWWYREQGGWQQRLLSPVSRIWQWSAARRLARGKPERAALPVICVGNFTAGGTGKTPISILIARLLIAGGERPVFLTRGYGGRLRGPHRVNSALDTAIDVGDEPLLLARHAPVIIARDRVAGAKLAAADFGMSPPTVIVMDDGLQNPALAKDLAIAVVDAVRGLGNGGVIPAGPLRATVATQFALAEAIVVNAAPGADPAIVEKTATRLRGSFHGPVIDAGIEADADGLDLQGARVLALAGIANPARFYSLLEQLGATIAGRVQFADHHAFTDADATRILTEASSLHARIVTTEKDLVRLAGAPGARAALREKAIALPIRVKLDQRNEVRLVSLINAAVLQRRKSQAKPALKP